MDTGEVTRLVIMLVMGALSPVVVRFGTLRLERKQRLQDHRDRFRRQTLLDVQDAINELAGVVCVSIRAGLDSGTLSHIPSDPLYFAAMTPTHTLAVRVADDRPRQSLLDLIEDTRQAALAGSAEEARDRWLPVT